LKEEEEQMKRKKSPVERNRISAVSHKPFFVGPVMTDSHVFGLINGAAQHLRHSALLLLLLLFLSFLQHAHQLAEVKVPAITKLTKETNAVGRRTVKADSRRFSSIVSELL